MDQVTTFRERYQQGTAYMSGELKSIEKNVNGVFREEENHQLEQEYMSAMEQGHMRMRMFGIQSSTFGKAQDVTADGMQEYFVEQQETCRVHQVAESGKKKKSRQEQDAKMRMGDRVTQKIQHSAENSAAQVLQLYREKKQQPVVDDAPMQGTEFYTSVKNETIDAQTQQQKISDLLIKRDALEAKVKSAKAASDAVAKAEQDYDKQLLEKLNDALRSWMLVGGVSGNGKRVSDREKAKALQHLPLAIESYEYYAKNRGMLIGGVVFEQFKRTKEYEDSYNEWREIDQESTQQTLGIDQPIANIYKDDIASLRSLISENGPYDADRQRLITSVYTEYMQHSVAFAKRNLEYKAAAYAMANKPKSKAYLDAWWAQNDFVSRQHEMAMDAAEAYLKYLIRGKTPDPTLAVYIEQHWHTDAFAAGLDQRTEDLYAHPDEYRLQMQERIDQIRGRTDLGEEKKDSLIFKLEHSLDNSQNQQVERLLSTSDNEIRYTEFVSKNCQVTDNDPNGGGYRDLVRVMMPVNGSVDDVNAQESVARKVGLVKFAKGVYLGDQKDENGQIIEEKRNGMACSDEERLAEFPALLAVLYQARQDLRQYIDQHGAAFGKQSLSEAYDTVEIPTGAYKKAQGMRDMCSVICQSPLFGELTEADRTQMIELWNFGSGLTDFTRERVTVIGNTTGRTLREVLADPASIASLGLTLEDAITSAARMHEQALAARKNG